MPAYPYAGIRRFRPPGTDQTQPRKGVILLPYSGPLEGHFAPANKAFTAKLRLVRARAELPSVEFPVGGLRAENKSFEGQGGSGIFHPRRWSVSGRSKQARPPEVLRMSNLEIMWTKVDEAPALATYLPAADRRKLSSARPA